MPDLLNATDVIPAVIASFLTYSPHRNTSCRTNGRWRRRTQSQRRCRICEFELDLYLQKKSAHCAWMNIREAMDVTRTASSDKNWHCLQMKVHFIGDYFVEKCGRTKDAKQ